MLDSVFGFKVALGLPATVTQPRLDWMGEVPVRSGCALEYPAVLFE
jgi:hypothetical protein